MSILKIATDGDPFPAKAGNVDGLPINDGRVRTFNDGTEISDQTDGFGGPLTYNIRYRGGQGGRISDGSVVLDESVTHLISPDEKIGVTVNGVAIYSSFTSVLNGYGANIVNTPSYAGYNWVLPEIASQYYAADACGGKPEGLTNEYRYRSGRFLKSGFEQNEEFRVSSDYFSNGNLLTHSDGHSKIIGWALDGYPIYGPFGYSDPINSNSNIAIMRSGYRVFDPLVDGSLPASRPGITGLTVLGAFKEDYVYDGSTVGVLDPFNGRFCKTPDFEDGTYAYFLTFSDGNINDAGVITSEPTTPQYPYIIGTSTREQRSY